MITISEGSKDQLPYIQAQIEPGRVPFTWWFEISTWEYNPELKGYCWYHYYEYDGGTFTLWRAYRKAQEVLGKVWMELAQKDSWKDV